MYTQGYWKALLDFSNFLEGHDIGKSKKQYKTICKSILKLLLQNRDKLETFMKYGGEVAVKVSPACEILDIGYDVSELKTKIKAE